MRNPNTISVQLNIILKFQQGICMYMSLKPRDPVGTAVPLLLKQLTANGATCAESMKTFLIILYKTQTIVKLQKKWLLSFNLDCLVISTILNVCFERTSLSLCKTTKNLQRLHPADLGVLCWFWAQVIFVNVQTPNQCCSLKSEHNQPKNIIWLQKQRYDFTLKISFCTEH